MSTLAGRWPIPVAAGERVHTRQGFRNLLYTGGVDIVMPDVGNCGGIFEAVQIADPDGRHQRRHNLSDRC